MAFLSQRSLTLSASRANVTRLLIDGGFIHLVGKGMYAWLPPGMRLYRNFQTIIEKEIRIWGGEEFRLPVLNPMQLREASGRDRIGADDFLLINDRSGAILVVAPDHEEALVDMLKQSIRHSSQLPLCMYQIQVKGRDVPETSSGIFNTRERLSLECYSVQATNTGLNNQVPRIFGMCKRIFAACGLDAWVAEGLPAFPGGRSSHDFIIHSRNGDHRVVACEQCHYVADQQLAVGLSKIKFSRLLPLSGLLGTQAKDLTEVAVQIGVPHSRVAVCEIWTSLNGLVLSIKRGDQEISPLKLGRLLGDPILGQLLREEYQDLGLVPNFVSPLEPGSSQLQASGIRVVIDTVVAETPNLVMGANKIGTYMANANFGRDFEGHKVGDICLVDERNRCYHCGGVLRVQKVIKLATLSRLDDHFCEKLEFTVTSEDGRQVHPHIAALSLSFDRLSGAIAQIHRDKRGLCWPVQIAPYPAVLLIVGKSMRLQKIAQAIHEDLAELLLWDDRSLPLGEKIRNADRLGIPVRVILSATTLLNGQALLMNRIDRSIVRIGLTDLGMALAKRGKFND